MPASRRLPRLHPAWPQLRWSSCCQPTKTSLQTSAVDSDVVIGVYSARLNGHDPYAYLKDVLERLPTQQATRIGELLPHNWKANSPRD